MVPWPQADTSYGLLRYPFYVLCGCFSGSNLQTQQRVDRRQGHDPRSREGSFKMKKSTTEDPTNLFVDGI